MNPDAVINDREQRIWILSQGEQLFLTVDANREALTNITLFRTRAMILLVDTRYGTCGPILAPGEDKPLAVLAVDHFGFCLLCKKPCFLSVPRNLHPSIK